MIRLLVYADVDLNRVDGSSVWLVSVAEALAAAGSLEVTVLQRTALERDVVVRDALEREEIVFVDPWQRRRSSRAFDAVLRFNRGARLHPASAATLVRALDEEHAFDVVLVRSLPTARILAGYPELARRLWVYMTDPCSLQTGDSLREARHILEGARRLVFQTPEAQEAFAEIAGNVDGRALLLPPLIPRVEPRRSRPDPARPKLGYSGKFSPGYHILEMLDAFARIRERVPNAEFHVIGEKFHDDSPQPGFVDEAKRRLRTDPGVVWHGGMTRREATRILAGVDVASSWRSSAFDSSVEASTKVLEYAALGIPVLLNSTPLQERLLGSDYPGFVSTSDEFADRFVALVSSPHVYERAARDAVAVAEEFTYARTRERLRPVLEADAARPLRVLVAGHDFKFLTPILEHLRADRSYALLEDRLEGHALTDVTRSSRLLAQSDVIFCEWALGNAEWYSKHKSDGQKLIVRLHSQELRLPYLDAIAWDAVDALVFICEHHRAAFLERFPELVERSHLIYNAVDVRALDRPKVAGAEFTLGLLGAAPQIKAPHLAAEMLERLRAVDARYRLRIKGKHPWEFDWLWRRPEERVYYERLYERLRELEQEGAVVFDGFGADVPAWLTEVGFILSMSDREGSHQSVAEGMASGAVPVIRNWPGADVLYPAEHVFGSVDEAVEQVLALRDPIERAAAGERCKRYARKRFDTPIVLDAVTDVLESVLHEQVREAVAV